MALTPRAYIATVDQFNVGETFMNTPISNPNVEKVFTTDVARKYEQVEKRANQAIQSFSSLVTELATLSQLSNGTKAKDQITKLTGELNNSSVFFAKMISEELNKLHGIVSPTSGSELPEQAEV